MRFETKEDLFISDLEKATTMNEILEVCQKHYDLNEKLGFGTRVVVKSGINKVIKLIRAKKMNL